MSIDLNIVVVDKTKEDVLSVVEKYDLGVVKNGFISAGFWFSFGTSPFYQEDEIKEAKENGWFKPHMELKGVRLGNTTYAGWSYQGEIRDMQFPVAHLLAQYFALYLNAVSFVDDPQTGKVTYYRRKDHPEIHDVLDGEVDGFTGEGYDNFCERKEGDEGTWEEIGWKAKRRKNELNY